MLARLLAQFSGARPAPRAAAPAVVIAPSEPAADASPATAATALRLFVANDIFPAYTLDDLRAQPLRRQAAEILAMQADAREAEALLRRRLEEDPEAAVDRMMLAEVLYKLGDYVQATALMEGLLADAGRMGARAAALLADQAFLRGDYARARALIGRAAAAAPYAVACQFVLGNLCDAAGAQSPTAYAQALAHFRRACAARPDLPLARVYLATALIRERAFQPGLEQWVAGEYLGGIYVNRELCPVWDGRPLGTDRLLLLTHSGYGDVIQFLRFARHLRACEPAARLSLMVRRPLAALARSSGLFEGVYDAGVGGVEFDWQVSQTHLPLLLGIDESALQAYEPYLAPAPARVAQAAQWLAPRRPGHLRVGLRWTGFAGYTDATRSVTLAALRPLLEVEGIDWISLAEGDSHRGEVPADFRLADVSMHLTDFEATAAVMQHLDLVIAVDTSVAHLAGALNLPTWLLARPNPDWRWGRDGVSTPWYGAVRVFRHAGGVLDWDGMAREMAAALRERISAQDMAG